MHENIFAEIGTKLIILICFEDVVQFINAKSFIDEFALMSAIFTGVYFVVYAIDLLIFVKWQCCQVEAVKGGLG